MTRVMVHFQREVEPSFHRGYHLLGPFALVRGHIAVLTCLQESRLKNTEVYCGDLTGLQFPFGNHPPNLKVGSSPVNAIKQFVDAVLYALVIETRDAFCMLSNLFMLFLRSKPFSLLPFMLLEGGTPLQKGSLPCVGPFLSFSRSVT